MMGEGKRSPLYHLELRKLLCFDELTVILVATIRWALKLPKKVLFRSVKINEQKKRKKK